MRARELGVVAVVLLSSAVHWQRAESLFLARAAGRPVHQGAFGDDAAEPCAVSGLATPPPPTPKYLTPLGLYADNVLSAAAPSGEPYPAGQLPTQHGLVHMLALAHFGLLSFGAFLMRLWCKHRALRLALGGFLYENALLAVAGLVGNRADVLGVPIFALLSIPSVLATSISTPALTCALASVVEREAKSGKLPCKLPLGVRNFQILVVALGAMTMRSSLTHLWSRSEMVPDTTWAMLGLVRFKALPRPPTLTLLCCPLVLLCSALSIGLQMYRAKCGAGVLAGALAMASGILGPESSCIWSASVGQMLLSLAAFLRLECPAALPAPWTWTAVTHSAPILGQPSTSVGVHGETLRLALRSASDAAYAGGAHVRLELAKALGLDIVDDMSLGDGTRADPGGYSENGSCATLARGACARGGEGLERLHAVAQVASRRVHRAACVCVCAAQRVLAKLVATCIATRQASCIATRQASRQASQASRLSKLLSIIPNPSLQTVIAKRLLFRPSKLFSAIPNFGQGFGGWTCGPEFGGTKQYTLVLQTLVQNSCPCCPTP